MGAEEIGVCIRVELGDGRIIVGCCVDLGANISGVISLWKIGISTVEDSLTECRGLGGSELCGSEDVGLEVWTSKIGVIEVGATEVGRIAVAMAFLSSELLITEDGVPDI